MVIENATEKRRGADLIPAPANREGRKTAGARSEQTRAEDGPMEMLTTITHAQMKLTDHEAQEFARAAQAMYARGENALGHLLSATSAKMMVPLEQYDRATDAYRAWLVFDEPKRACDRERFGDDCAYCA